MKTIKTKTIKSNNQFASRFKLVETKTCYLIVEETNNYIRSTTTPLASKEQAIREFHNQVCFNELYYL